MLVLVLTNRERLVGNVKLKDSLGCSDNEMVKFKIFRAAIKPLSIVPEKPWQSGEVHAD